VVIGGLYRSTSSTQENSVPFLGKIKGIIILIALIIVVAGAGLVFLGGEEPFQEPEIISKTIKIVEPEEPAKPVKEVAEVEPEPKPVPAPKPKAEKVPPPAKKASVTFKPWAVNVASFSQRAEALSFAKALKSAGYNPYVTEFIMNNLKF
jgi:outer membrane biosynthesis protein TonB